MPQLILLIVHPSSAVASPTSKRCIRPCMSSNGEPASPQIGASVGVDLFVKFPGFRHFTADKSNARSLPSRVSAAFKRKLHSFDLLSIYCKLRLQQMQNKSNEWSLGFMPPPARYLQRPQAEQRRCRCPGNHLQDAYIAATTTRTPIRSCSEDLPSRLRAMQPATRHVRSPSLAPLSSAGRQIPAHIVATERFISVHLDNMCVPV